MGILGYPNMDDDNQEGAFGDYSDIYTNFSEDKNTTPDTDDNASGEAVNTNVADEQLQADWLNDTAGTPLQQPKQNKSTLLPYLIVLGLLLMGAAGMYLYKQNTESSSVPQEQSMGDYFYDQANQNQEAAQPEAKTGANNEQTATVEVDLSTPAPEANNPAQDKKINQTADKEDKVIEEKVLTAFEKAELKKKNDEKKENQIGFSTAKSVVIPVSAGGRLDPFMPFGQASMFTTDKSKFELIAPPTTLPDPDPVLDELMQTKISGIMYDSARPSAIVNFGGVDQLVHKGDIVKGYNILNITQNTVVIKYKSNVYHATVGQSLDSGVNLNPVSNLTTQFGGAYSKTPDNVIQFNN